MIAVTQDGKRCPIELGPDLGEGLIDGVNSILSSNGITGSQLQDLILVPASGGLAVQDGPFPPIPRPANKDDLPPQTSETILVASPVVPLWLYYWGDKGESHGSYLPVSTFPTDPPFPENSKLAYKRYWNNLGSYRLTGPQSFSKEITATEGMSKTNQTTLSAELGLEVKGLSAKLSAETSTSITISTETSVKVTYSCQVPADQVYVYTTWQLVEMFQLVDSAGNPISWRGHIVVKAGRLTAKFKAKFPTNTVTQNAVRYASDIVPFPA